MKQELDKLRKERRKIKDEMIKPLNKKIMELEQEIKNKKTR